MREKSTTADELAHITGGYTFDHWNDYRLHPENGILPQRWQALPAVFAGAHSPDLSSAAWRKSDVWVMGYRYFYESGNNSSWLLFSARAMNSLFGAATALLVFFWSRRVWGDAGAIVSAVFCALCPTMLAHSGLATSDMCMTFFLLLAVAAYWHHLHSGKWSSLLVSAGVFGLAGVAKHTSVLLLPMALLMAIVRLCQPAPLQFGRWVASSWWGRFGLTGLSLAVHGAAVVFFLWAFFGFRYGAFNPALPPGVLADPWSILLSGDELPTRVIAFCRNWRLLPEGYLYGLAFVLKHSHARGAFLDGEYSIYGWVGFFPKTFLYKTPLSLLAGLVASVVLLAVRCRTLARSRLAARLHQVVPLIVLFTVYWLFSFTSHLNIGHRHILPTYPVLYIFCGVLGWSAWTAARRSRAGGVVMGVLIVVLLGWHAAVAAKIHPDYLAYFSPIAGGPEEGYKHLVDSSLDWGQDLPALKKWLAANQRPGEKVYLSYFGSAEPEYYGLDAIRLPTLPDFERP
ncbi:MAG: hypothetical protein JWQ62_666, partial [Lacunisphaera sp.]|nr:hypothetical protein [Lacunisphaera sp.]